ncbi:hypothetical protein F511_06452 [Dorcoceras hygrometricum]|uniref:Uncharacterized protein n=1 Tax=Dorcoceras hygrometricum TaxID=472368 RepID=A0A2Z7B7X9_9LAMI|nr:hypothetical protein F511_06452 [Dorcoceras hygrometricum]
MCNADPNKTKAGNKYEVNPQIWLLQVQGKQEVADAPRVKKTPVKKAASKKRPATDAAAKPVVKKKRTTKSKSVSAKETLEILPVAQEAVPLQMIAPTPAAPTEQSPLPKRTTQKRKRRLILGSDDEIFDSEPVICGNIVGEAAVEVVDDTTEKDVETVVESVDEPVSLPAVADVLIEGISTADDVDIIIEQVIAETAQIQTDEGDKDVDTTDVGEKTVEKADELEQWLNLSYEEFHAQQPVVTASDTYEDMETVEEMETEAVEQSADEAMSLEDILMTIPVEFPLPSTNVGITPITLGTTISILGVHEGYWYKAGLPKIPATDKGRAPLHERDPVKGNPIKEQFSLIVADINLLSPVIYWRLSQLCTAFVQYSLFSGLSTADITSFVSTIAFEITVFRDVKIAQSSISVSPSVQMMIDQSPFSSSTSDDSSMRFDDNDTADTSISLPPAATNVMESLAKLHASVDQVQCEQFRRRDDAHNFRDILLVHIQDLEQKISARFDEHDRVHRELRKDMHDQKNLSSLDLKSTHQKLSAQIAAAAFDTVDVRKEVKEINAKVNYLDGQKKGESGSSRPQPPPDDQSRPNGGSGGSGTRERGSRGGSQRRGDRSGSSKRRLTAVVVDRSEDHLKIG